MGFPVAWTSAVRRVGWLILFASVLLSVQSALWTERIPWVIKAGLVAVAILAALRPADALLVVAGLVPLSYAVAAVWNLLPLSLGEAMVLAFFAGYLWSQRRVAAGQASSTDPLAPPSRLLALVVVASCLVQLVVLQTLHEYPLRYALGFVRFMATDYLTMVPDPRPWVDGRRFVAAAALLLEGLGLLRCTNVLCAKQPALALRLTKVVVAGGTAVALLTFYEVGAAALSTRAPFWDTVTAHRWASVAMPSVDTVGVYFMLLAFLAMGTAAMSGGARLFLWAACAVNVVAMCFTQTRAAVVAGLATAVGGAIWWAAHRISWLSRDRVLAVAVLVATTVGIVIVVFNPFHILAAGGEKSLYLRVLLAGTALRMIAAHPLAGVGVGQYALRFPEFASPELLRYYANNNAHNYFLDVWAEVGPIGLGCLLWLLAVALAPGWSRLRRGRLDYAALGTYAGLTAFIVTWSIGEPLGVPLAAYAFWIVLGASAWTGHREPAAVEEVRVAARSGPVWAVLVMVVVGSVPIRAYRAVSEIDLSRADYGFYNWDTTTAGRVYRRTGPQATLFARSSIRAIKMPLAADRTVTPKGARIDVVVDGQLADRIVLTTGDWQTSDAAWHTLRVNAPLSPGRVWRVDLHVVPLGPTPPAFQLGVIVGEISFERRPPGDTAVQSAP